MESSEYHHKVGWYEGKIEAYREQFEKWKAYTIISAAITLGLTTEAIYQRFAVSEEAATPHMKWAMALMGITFVIGAIANSKDQKISHLKDRK